VIIDWFVGMVLTAIEIAVIFFLCVWDFFSED
jgi:hypothetical protein